MNELTNIFESFGFLKTATKKKELLVTKKTLIIEQVSILPEISLAEVAKHDDYRDCWIVIYDRVYNVTSFLHLHPGGDDIIMEHAGRDATFAFNGTGHSNDALDQLHEYCIGELPLNERMCRIDGGKALFSNLPK